MSQQKIESAYFYRDAGELIDALRSRLDVKSDGKVAEALGLHRAAVSNWRIGKANISPGTAKKMAKILGIPLAPILMWQLEQAEPDPDIRAVYHMVGQQFWRRLRRTVPIVAIMALAVGSSSKTLAATQDNQQLTTHTLYIMRTRRRRALARRLWNLIFPAWDALILEPLQLSAV